MLLGNLFHFDSLNSEHQWSELCNFMGNEMQTKWWK